MKHPNSLCEIDLTKCFSRNSTFGTGEIESKSTPEDLTFRSALNEYENLLNNNLIQNKKSGMSITEATKNNMTRVITLARQSNIDFNFTLVHPGSSSASLIYERFTSEVKAFVMRGRQISTVWAHLSSIRNIIKVIGIRHDMDFGKLLQGFTINYVEKEVVVLTHAQVQFLLSNYKLIRSGCKGKQLTVLDYGITALLINPRVKDMSLFTIDNLYSRNGSPWIKYRPHKTRNSSRLIIDVPIPALLGEIFERNIAHCGRPLPVLDIRGISIILKAIAKKFPIFSEEVQIQKDDSFIKLPQWKTITMHQMRASGITDKLGAGMPEALVKAYSGHSINSRSFPRYVNIGSDSKERFAKEYFKTLRAV